MQWLKLQGKLLPYKVAWLLVVGFSIVYTLRGMQAIFPGDTLFYFKGNPVTETHLLGIALCLGQYTMLSISFNLFGSESKLHIKDKTMAISGLVIGIILTISNTTFAFKAINMSKDDVTVKVEMLISESASLQNQILMKTQQLNTYNAQLALVPKEHSTNIRRMFQDIQPYVEKTQAELTDLQNRKFNKDADLARLKGQSETNRNFSLSGMDGSKLISMIMSLALDPIAIMIMLSMQSLRSQYWKELKSSSSGAPISLKEVTKRIRRSGHNPIGSSFRKSDNVEPIRPMQEVQLVDYDPPTVQESEIDVLELSIPAKKHN
ncbi:hypothetical protein [Ewingella americana]|uniref:Uncharacterized protein n=1 Tax=Ewingella americana TaxID=41202 RepID=A0A502GFG0_9GAMM|nr:hypothetical protein [Ewingella americana]TPG60020.1 hypothetical protein EAH77_15750 [Ewingella americana]